MGVMIEQNTKALYNSLREHWKQDPSIDVEEWQISDYRSMTTEELFEHLQELGYRLDREAFLAYAEECETPEELTENLFEEEEPPEDDEDGDLVDQLFLVIFELWRRILPENRTLSILCDEIDHVISAYDEETLDQGSVIEDLLANLIEIVEAHNEEGTEAPEVFQQIARGCANDLEGFLYEYIAELEDEGNISYASELTEAFSRWVSDVKWFDFLHARAVASQDPEAARTLIEELLSLEEDDFVFYLEMLTFLVQEGDEKIFVEGLQRTLSLTEVEEDFAEILDVSKDYFLYLDREVEEEKIAAIMSRRSTVPPEESFDASTDPDSKFLLSLFTSLR
jgi:DNA-directed RNA polymerase subunit F